MRNWKFFLALIWTLPMVAQQGFVHNEGQWKESFSFKIQIGPNSLFLTPDSLVVAVLDPADFHSEHIGEHHHYSDTLHYHHFSMVFKSSQTMHWMGEEPYDVPLSYFVGKQDFWRSGVQSFHKVRARNVYPGIDLVVYEAAGGFKFDWELAAGADPDQISIAYHGLEGWQVKGKELVLQTRFGPLVEEMPYALQKEHTVRARYKETNGDLGYDLGRFRRDEPLTIDPIYIFSTYTGSSVDNFGYTATFDDSSNAIGGGIAFGAGYPTTLGAVDISFNGGLFDVAISKFSSDGSQLLWSTYLGGSNLDQPYSMDCDENGNVYILGSTGSDDFGVTSTAYDTSFAGGASITAEYYTFNQGTDLFVSKINAAGNQLVGSTYIGGAGSDGINDSLRFNYGDSFRGEIEVQRNGGAVYFVSSTFSSSYPTIVPATSHQGGQDGVISVLNRNLTQLLASTYVGTSGNEALYSIALADKQGLNFPSPSFKFTPFYVAGSIGPSTDSSIAMGWLNPAYDYSIPTSSDQDALLLSGYLGLSGVGTGNYIAMSAVDVQADSGYNQHFFVETHSETDTASIVTVVGQHKGGLVADSLTWGQPGSAQYFQRFKRDGNSGFSKLKTAVWGDSAHTTVDVSPTALLVDDCGNTYFSGWGGSPNPEGNTEGMALSANAFQTTTDGRDFYFLVLDPDWKSPRLATYFGGVGREHVDGGTSRFDRTGRIFQAVCAGCGGTSTYPTFPNNVYASSNGSSNCNLAVTVIDLDVQNARVSVQPDPPVFCLPNTFSILDSSINVQDFTVYWGDGNSTSSTSLQGGHVYASPGTYPVQVIGHDTICDTWDTATFTVQVNPAYDSVYTAYAYDFCDPLRAVTAQLIHASDSTLVTDRVMDWTISGASFTTPQVSTNLPSAGYNVITLTTVDTVCNVVQTFTDTLLFRLPPYLNMISDPEECTSDATVDVIPVYNSVYQGYNWLVDGVDQGSPDPLQISQSGIYEISIVGYDSICGTSDTLTATYDIFFAQEPFIVPNVITPNGDNVNDRWTINTNEDWDRFHVILFNRWGIKVFETNAPTFNWGADYDGQILTPGVYFYQVEAENRCGITSEEGTLHITY